MLSRLREKEERIQLILECLAEESGKGIPIVVEGLKDLKALEALGVRGKILLAKAGGKSMLDLISEIEECRAPEVILLLDFDKSGREWTRRLKQRLEKSETRPNTEYWNQLLQLVWREVKDIEGLASFMETLKGKLAGCYT